MELRSLPLAVLTRYLAQEIFELDRSFGLFVTILDDDRGVNREPPVLRRADADSARARDDDRARWNFERLVAFAPVNYAARRVEDRSRACQHNPGGQDRPLAHEGPFVDATVAAEEHFIFDNHGHCAHRFEHAADLSRRADVASFAG